MPSLSGVETLTFPSYCDCLPGAAKSVPRRKKERISLSLSVLFQLSSQFSSSFQPDDTIRTIGAEGSPLQSKPTCTHIHTRLRL